MTHEELAQLVKKHAMTRRELARDIGKNASMVSQWIIGNAPMSAEIQQLFEEYFASKKNRETELHLLPPGARFRLPGKSRVFKKNDNNQFLKVKVISPDGTVEIVKKPACKCYNSNNCIFIKSWYEKVIALDDDVV